MTTLGSSAAALSSGSKESISLRLGISRAQFDGVRRYLCGLKRQAEPEPKRRRVDATIESLFIGALSSQEKTVLDKRLLVLVADRRLPFSFMKRDAFIAVVRLLREAAVS